MVGLEEEAAAAMAAPAVDEVCWPWPSAITALPGDGNISLSQLPFLLCFSL
jgi:hypothetical protein